MYDLEKNFITWAGDTFTFSIIASFSERCNVRRPKGIQGKKRKSYLELLVQVMYVCIGLRSFCLCL